MKAFSEIGAPPCQCSYHHVGYCNETCPNDREHDPWCSQAGRPVDTSRRDAMDRIAVALGLHAGIGEPFITDALVRLLAVQSRQAFNFSICQVCGGLASIGHIGDCMYALAVAYVAANPK